jgi:hypothetical protein
MIPIFHSRAYCNRQTGFGEIIFGKRRVSMKAVVTFKDLNSSLSNENKLAASRLPC